MLLRAIVTGILLAVVVACAPVTPMPEAGVSESAGVVAGAGEAGGDGVGETCAVAATSPDQEGPYYRTGSPERASLIEDGMAGRPIRVSGRVLAEDCTPVVGAQVDFWQADAAGVYDNEGYRLRGHVVSDEMGRYAIETIEPGPYTGRPPHIHVKVLDADGGELLTTQLYFPGEDGSLNGRVAPDLIVMVADESGDEAAAAGFDFVVRR